MRRGEQYLRRPYLEALPRGAVAPVCELVEGDRLVPVLRQIDAEELRLRVPDGEDAHSGGAHVQAFNQGLTLDPRSAQLQHHRGIFQAGSGTKSGEQTVAKASKSRYRLP